MTPALIEGQDVLSFNWAYLGRKPRVGDIVIVKSEKLKVKSEIVKRVERVEGDKIYVIGDNLEESTDSRDFGAIGVNQIVGKVVYRTVIPAKAGIQLKELGSELDSRLRGNDNEESGNDRMVDCPKCGLPVIGIYGRKDAICQNCGFKLACCGEP